MTVRKAPRKRRHKFDIPTPAVQGLPPRFARPAKWQFALLNQPPEIIAQSPEMRVALNNMLAMDLTLEQRAKVKAVLWAAQKVLMT